MKPPLPPSYVNTPVPIAYAEVDDALIVTMTRILGLCWAHNYERSPALSLDRLAELTGRPRSTLCRHLKQLRDMEWIRVDQTGRRLIIRPIIACHGEPVEKEVDGRVDPADGPAPDEALLQALAGIGVENPKRSQLARREIDPLCVHAWYLWAKHPHRQTLTNPVGNIILKLESGERPPGEFLRAAEEQIRYRTWMQGQEEGDGEVPEEEEPPEPEPESVPAEACRIWARALDELQLQMTRATFDTWLRGSRVAEAGDGRLTIAVRHAFAVDWLQHRLLSTIRRTVARHAGAEMEIAFVADA